MVRERVVKAASQVDRHPVLARQAGGENRAAGAEPHRFAEFRREGDLEGHHVRPAELAPSDFLQVARCVDESHLFIGRELRLPELGLADRPIRDQPVAGRAILAGWEDMEPDIDFVGGVEDDGQRGLLSKHLFKPAPRSGLPPRPPSPI